MKPRLSLIVAMAKNRVIGINNTLPWHLPADLRRFKALTMGHHIVMGRKTYESIGKPLPGRVSVVVTRNPDFSLPGAIVAYTLEAALSACGADQEIFVIGGAELYRQALELADRIYLTEIDAEFEGNTRFPELAGNRWHETARESFAADEKNAYPFHFVVYDKTH